MLHILKATRTKAFLLCYQLQPQSSSACFLCDTFSAAVSVENYDTFAGAWRRQQSTSWLRRVALVTVHPKYRPTHLHPSSFTILSQPHAAATAHARFRPDRRNFMGTVCVKWNREEEADGLSLNFKNPVIILKSSGKYTECLFYVVL